MADQTITITYGNGATQDVDVSIMHVTQTAPSQPTFVGHSVGVGNNPDIAGAWLELRPQLPTSPVVPPSPMAYAPSVPASVATRLHPTPLFDDQFLKPEVWGTTWGDDWFGGERFNGLTLDPANISWLTGGGVILRASNGGTVGCMMQTNPQDPLTPGFAYQYGYDETDAIIATDCPWATIWSNGYTWPTDGENDIIESVLGTQTTNYHGPITAGGTTDLPRNVTVPSTWGTFIGVRCKYGNLRVPGYSIRYFTLGAANPMQVANIVTTDNGAPQYLVLSNGATAGGGTGSMIVYRRTVWGLIA